MKLYKKICLFFLSLCFSFLILGNIKIKAISILPSSYSNIFANSTINITNDMDNDYGVFRLRNYNSRFVEIKFTATSTSTVSYPSGCIQVKNSSYQLIKKCNIDDFQNNALNQNNINTFVVFLSDNSYYYIEINYDMTNITKLELLVSVINTSNNINLFNYGTSEEFTINQITNSNSLDKITQFKLNQSGQYKITIDDINQANNSLRHVLLKKNDNGFEVIKNILVTSNINYSVNLDEGIYYIGYFDLQYNDYINITLTRKITSYGSYHLIPDPDRLTPCGSQIYLEERNIDVLERSYREVNITEGFTRLIYLDQSAPSDSRLDYNWYSSDEEVIKVTDYGTILALPINTTLKSCQIMAVYKDDMSKVFVKDFVVEKDDDTYLTNPIDISVSLIPQVNQYISIDLSNVDVPINMLQYYTWVSSSSNVSVDTWGRVFSSASALGQNIDIVGTYNYNNKIKIHVSGSVVLPLSGSELEYQPEIWNIYPIQERTNCYSYAFNTQVYPNTNTLCYMQPGFANRMYDYTNESDLSILSEYVNLANIVRKVQQDSYNVGFTFEEVNKFTKCENGTYKVALVIDNGVDFHWYRQNKDGTWSHKPGQTAVTNLDASGNLIYDPESCNKDYESLNYNDDIKFYKISPINNFYHEASNSQSNYITYSIDQNNLNISIGLTFNQINELLGTSTQICSFGIIKYKYICNNDIYIITYLPNSHGDLIVLKIEHVG